MTLTQREYVVERDPTLNFVEGTCLHLVYRVLDGNAGRTFLSEVKTECV